MEDLLPNYEVGGLLGSGSFGKVALARDKETKQLLALKFEEKDLSQSYLIIELQVYKALNKDEFFPQVLVTTETSNHRVLGMELLGRDIEWYLKQVGSHFSLKTVAMIGYQMLCRLERLHLAGWIHRDIKPQNIVTGIGAKRSILYLIDYGLATPIVSHKSQSTHTTLCKTIIGNARYSSVSNHMGRDQGPRDDLESLAYCLVYLARGSLPWSSVTKDPNAGARADVIATLKMTSSVNEICGDLPEEFSTFLREVKSLKVDDTPQYSKYRELFREVLIRECYSESSHPFNDRKMVNEGSVTFYSTHNRRASANDTQKIVQPEMPTDEDLELAMDEYKNEFIYDWTGINDGRSQSQLSARFSPIPQNRPPRQIPRPALNGSITSEASGSMFRGSSKNAIPLIGARSKSSARQLAFPKRRLSEMDRPSLPKLRRDSNN